MKAPSIQETALRVLEKNPDAVVRHRLLRDVLRRPAGDWELEQARSGLEQSRWVRELAGEQWPDGGWGPFHSLSTRLKQVIPSTELGVERALVLGLDRDHPVLARASAYIRAIMQGEIPFPDYQEKNDRWQTGMRLFLASTLASIEAEHPLLDQDRALWLEIARRTFGSGRYREEDEIAAHTALTGATVQGSYLVLSNRYTLNLLGSVPGLLFGELQKALLAWLWERPGGIGYLGEPLGQVPPSRAAGRLDRWLASLELLARRVPLWAEYAAEGVRWLWEQRDQAGFWDLGPRPSQVWHLPLSDSWRRRESRVFDWTTRILLLVGHTGGHDATDTHSAVGE